MDFINFEAKIDNIDDDNDIFFDDTSDISESVCKHYAFQNVEVNLEEVLKEVHEKAVSDLDKVSEVRKFSNDLVEELPEIIEFSGSQKKINKFEKSKFFIESGL